MPRPPTPGRTWADAAMLRSIADALDAAAENLGTAHQPPYQLHLGALTIHVDLAEDAAGRQALAIDLLHPCKRAPEGTPALCPPTVTDTQDSPAPS